MKIGFMQVYNEVNWISYAIDQAMMLCDKLLITEGSQFVAFPDIPERSNDGTLDIINDKSRQYGKQIVLLNTIRKHGNYRRNQCDNFNRGLTLCDLDDYFIILDADIFFANEWIVRANKLMMENNVDLVTVRSYFFTFGFKWRIVRNPEPDQESIIIKKTEKLHFIPTHKYSGIGNNQVLDPGVSLFHYMWVKPSKRIQMRMRTSGMYAGMLEWFKKVWLNIELEDGRIYQSYHGQFMLRRYDDSHPSILDNHPWRDIEDIRKMT